jgi:hypothetical protein
VKKLEISACILVEMYDSAIPVEKEIFFIQSFRKRM